jgi:hypothetical protein
MAKKYMHPVFRKRDLAEALCKHVEIQAKEVFGFDKIYLFTHAAEAFFLPSLPERN